MDLDCKRDVLLDLIGLWDSRALGLDSPWEIVEILCYLLLWM